MKKKIIKLLGSPVKEDITLAFEFMLNQLSIKEIRDIFYSNPSIKTTFYAEYWPYFKIGEKEYVIHHSNSTWIYKYGGELYGTKMYSFLHPYYLGEHKDYKP